MSEANNECRCPFPTLNGHAAHCAIGQNEKNIEELRKMLPSDKWYANYDFAGEMARIREMNREYRTQIEQIFARPENAFFKDIPYVSTFDEFQPVPNETMKQWYENGCKIAPRIVGVNLHSLDETRTIKVNPEFNIQNIELFNFALNEQQIKELRDGSHYSQAWALPKLPPLSAERRSEIENIMFGAPKKTYFEKLMETPIESYKKLNAKYYGIYCYEYPKWENTSDRLTKSQFTQLKEAAQKAVQEKMATIMEKTTKFTNDCQTDFNTGQEFDLSEMLIYEHIEASPKTSEASCVCQQLFAKGHEPTCHLAR